MYQQRIFNRRSLRFSDRPPVDYGAADTLSEDQRLVMDELYSSHRESNDQRQEDINPKKQCDAS